jgi:hypothetical protein
MSELSVPEHNFWSLSAPGDLFPSASDGHSGKCRTLPPSEVQPLGLQVHFERESSISQRLGSNIFQNCPRSPPPTTYAEGRIEWKPVKWFRNR